MAEAANQVRGKTITQDSTPELPGPVIGEQLLLPGPSGDSNTIVPDNSQFPQTRLDIHNDLISKGYHTTGTTDKGYVVYKDGNGHIVTIKPSGEVIPTTRMPVDPNNTSPKAQMYNQRTYYDGTIIPDEINDHTTGHYVGKISIDDFFPEPYKWDGTATWMEEN